MRQRGDPYFLYAVSNAGSLLALLAYPLLVEPTMSLDWQATLWSWGFGALALGIALCAAVTLCAALGPMLPPWRRGNGGSPPVCASV